MALSRRAWVAAGLAARLLMLAVLAMSLQSRFSNKVHYDFKSVGYNNELHSYTKRMTPSTLILDASTYADIVVTAVLASGVGAGFGATGDLLYYIEHACSPWNDDATQDLTRYFREHRHCIGFLLIGMVLSLCATVVSVRLRVRASDDDV
ncbi:LOW QUALITY PROTEIN: hypothetical protein GQ55_1G269500 [Panicum hallii var. hallii]|uniref:CASP-like protein n=1 Tax=Panicum hallii var. hallii TaxID=1504633 RepID=A0A2T7F7W8_9POAL|nr:LOW QUALITY PROTEIN: hypothetical protein GQ55_1G269500 [Panicum hallii var. hallii]